MHELYDLLGNRPEDQRAPAGDAVRGDHDHVDMFALNYLHDVSCHVISNFDTETCLDLSCSKNRVALREAQLCFSPCIYAMRIRAVEALRFE